MARDPSEQLRLILGLKVRSLRQRGELSLQQLSDASGLSVSYLSEIEKGRKYPKPEKLLDLAGALGVGYDDLVSTKVDEELGPLKALASSALLHEFPLELFGLRTEDVVSLVRDAPDRAGALLRALLDIGRAYDVQVEQFLLAALRSYQQLHRNSFPELEKAAETFRAARGWEPAGLLAPEDLEGVLRERGYALDYETLPAHPDLSGLRSVLVPGDPPRLLVNGRLLPSQRAFVLGREIGYHVLGLEERALTSSWLQVESFEQVLNNFKASYFSGALLLPREPFARDLEAFFARETWSPEAVEHLLVRWGTTPETLFHRFTQLVPARFGLPEIYFMRFSHRAGSGRFRLTKTFNLSRVPVPYEMGLHEHHCRRWPAMQLLARLAAEPGRASALEPLVMAQRSWFLDEGAEFFVLSMARPLALDRESGSAVSLGFLVDDDFRRVARFAADPGVPRLTVNLTCERCPLTPEECGVRAAPPRVVRHREEQARRQRALAELAEERAGA